MRKTIIRSAFVVTVLFTVSVRAQVSMSHDSVAVKNLQQFIESNPASVSSLRRLKMLVYTEDYDQLMPLYNRLSAGIRNSDSGKKLLAQLNAIKKLTQGSIAPDFTLPDTLGQPIALSSFRGKYVLVDFWASWCVPCRKENPDMIKLYNKFKAKSFTILGVSLDKASARQAWVNAINTDRLKWAQVSDLQGWNSAAAKLYGIRAIPQNYLVDASGKIVAKNLHGDALEAKIAEVLDGLKDD